MSNGSTVETGKKVAPKSLTMVSKQWIMHYWYVVKAIPIMSVHYINSIAMIGWLKMIIYASIIVIWKQ